MVKKKKRKGTDWERELVNILNNLDNCAAKRVPMSGAVGTYVNEPTLAGDVVFVIDDMPKKFRIECKTGYGNSTQMTIKREWFEKIKAEAQNSYSIPLVALKLSGVRDRDAVKHIIAMDLDTFIELVKLILSLRK